MRRIVVSGTKVVRAITRPRSNMKYIVKPRTHIIRAIRFGKEMDDKVGSIDKMMTLSLLNVNMIAHNSIASSDATTHTLLHFVQMDIQDIGQATLFTKLALETVSTLYRFLRSGDVMFRDVNTSLLILVGINWVLSSVLATHG